MSEHTTRPFTRSAALAAGLNDNQLRGMAFQRIFFGVYVRAGIKVGLAERAHAALLVSPPGSYVSHTTAAALWGAPVLSDPRTHVTSPPDLLRSVRRGIAAHRAQPEVQPAQLRGMPLSAPARSFVETAALSPDLVDLVTVGDGLVRAGRTTPEQLAETAARYYGNGARLARRAASLVRAGVDSTTETRTRLLLVLAGLPEPTVNLILRNGDGEWLWRLDLGYRQLRLAIEYDGRDHIDIRNNWVSDIRRREKLQRQGWCFIVITAEGLYGDPAGTVARVVQALQDRGVQELPRRFPPEWHRIFGQP